MSAERSTDADKVSLADTWVPSACYIPPLNFGMVEEDLYRSGAPNELNFPFLERLGLKTIIYLAPDEPDQQLFVSLQNHAQ